MKAFRKVVSWLQRVKGPLSLYSATTLGCAFLFTGCEGIKVIDVEPEAFVKDYEKDRTSLTHADYKGIVNGYHCMDIYGPGTTSVSHLMYRLRVHQNRLPSDFPNRPQRPIETPPAQRAGERTP